MAERARRKLGDIVVAPNGYSYTYVLLEGELTRVLTHHKVAFDKYGRWPSKAERCIFKDNDRFNLDPGNIALVAKGATELRTLKSRRRTVRDKLRELNLELESLNERITAIEESA